MDPVCVRLYGLFPITKPRYIRQLAATVLLLAVLLVGWWFMPDVPLPEGPPLLAAAGWLLKNLPWLVLGLTALVLLEAVVVFRRFARAAAARPAPPPAKPDESPTPR